MSDDDLYQEAVMLQLTQGLDIEQQTALKIPILKLINNNLDAHMDTVALFLEREIDTSTFIEKQNDNAVKIQAELLEVIGEEQYIKAMDAEPGDFYMLIDPTIAMATYGEAFTLDQE